MNILRVSTLSLTLAIAAFSLGYVNPSFAGKPDGDGNHNHGGEGEDGDVYEVAISGDIMGGSTTPWSRSGGEKSIGGQQPNDGFLTLLNPFFQSVADVNGLPFNSLQATACFGVGSFPIRGGGLGTGKKDVAKAQFWFDAKTFEQNLTLTYQLQYLGGFSGAGWPS